MVTLDNTSGWVHAAFMKEKSQQLDEFKAFKVAFERQHGVRVRFLQSDGGGEYNSDTAC